MNSRQWLSDLSLVKCVRPAQVEMGGVIEQTLQDGGIAMIEAPTGTGKSYAYLVPALLHGKRIVVSTAKKTLQSQLQKQDIPYLLGKLQLTNSVCCIKGKSNYVCKLRLQDYLSRQPFVSKSLHAFSQWAAAHVNGDIDDYPEPHTLDFAPNVRVQECIHRNCPHYQGCGFRAVRGQATSSSIVLVNHALLAADCYLNKRLLGDADVLIIDEAHQAIEAFRGAYQNVIHNKLPDFLKRALADSPMYVPKNFEQQIHQLLTQIPGDGILEKSKKIVDLMAPVLVSLEDLKQQCIHHGVWTDDDTSDAETTTPNNQGIDASVFAQMRASAEVTKRMLKACNVYVDQIARTNNTDAQAIEYVVYTQSQVRKGVAVKELIVAPLDTGTIFRSYFKSKKSVILTSATLATGQNNFDYFARQFGVSSNTKTYIMPQTFNYPKNSCLYIPNQGRHYGPETRETYWDFHAQQMHQLLQASKGGAFVLCASYEDMQEFEHRLALIPNKQYTTNMQTGSVDALVNWFKHTPNSVILGVKALWEGVDIPGLTLRLVIIPRIPFPTKNNAVLQAQKQRYIQHKVEGETSLESATAMAWNQFDLQAALIDLKQGAGRLIRNENDRGVVALLDIRAYQSSKNYSSTIRNTFPHPVTYDGVQVCNFLELLAKAHHAHSRI